MTETKNNLIYKNIPKLNINPHNLLLLMNKKEFLSRCRSI
ncbi:protein of unknown function [[Clostridium] ultunense Esp]|uniref:Uncharacterized protein n=1 Tax=[Clostridium] ultunense Esp TaxID=1288971 RepID=A0A1M4PMI2_9FIRM|nr:protein of unknown function [[Clostridium] ultunense Esp]